MIVVESKDIEDDLSKDLEKSCNIQNEEILNDTYILNKFINNKIINEIDDIYSKILKVPNASF